MRGFKGISNGLWGFQERFNGILEVSKAIHGISGDFEGVSWVFRGSIGSLFGLFQGRFKAFRRVLEGLTLFTNSSN